MGQTMPDQPGCHDKGSSVVNQGGRARAVPLGRAGLLESNASLVYRVLWKKAAARVMIRATVGWATVGEKPEILKYANLVSARLDVRPISST